MFRQVLQRITPLGNAISNPIQRNFGVTALAAQKVNLDPIQQLFVDKIREYRSKSVGGKLVDASAETENFLKELLGNLERAYGAKGVDMTQFPTLNFAEPELLWPGLTADQKQKISEAVDNELKMEQKKSQEVEEAHKYNYFEGYE